MWPASKSVPKEVFPLGRVPAIVHLVWELQDAGIRRIVIVASQEGLQPLMRLLDPSVRPPEKIADDPLVQRFQQTLATVEFVLLSQTGNYGNGTPLLLASDEVNGSPCIYAFGDDIVFDENVSKGLLDTYSRTGCPVLASQNVDPERTSQFGIIESVEKDHIQYVTRLIEKPSAGVTTSTLAAFGRYLVTPDLIDLLRRHTPPGRDNEVWFVDSVIRRILEGSPVCAFTLTKGKWYTVGDPTSYAQAVAAVQNQAFMSSKTG